MSTSNTSWENRRWSRLADKMEAFHGFLKEEYEQCYKLADGSFNQRGMSTNAFLRSVLEFKHHLESHHTIEERVLFPFLAKKMPSFAQDDRHTHSHHLIHEGLTNLSKTISKFQNDLTSYSPQELRACLDSFREPLFTHLEEEVRDISPEEMKKYWTLEELEKLPV